MQAFQDDLLKFASLNAQVLGVSADDLETHKRFSRELGLQFPLISDSDRKLAGLYGQGRISFLIDKEGVIRLIQTGFPKIGELLAEIRKLEKKVGD
jgi:peroxiredoxin Q/BCP